MHLSAKISIAIVGIIAITFSLCACIERFNTITILSKNASGILVNVPREGVRGLDGVVLTIQSQPIAPYQEYVDRREFELAVRKEGGRVLKYYSDQLSNKSDDQIYISIDKNITLTASERYYLYSYIESTPPEYAIFGTTSKIAIE